MRKFLCTGWVILFAISVHTQIPQNASFETYMVIGDSLAKKWDHAGAMRAYENALRCNPNSYEAAWKAGDETTEYANRLSSHQKKEKEEYFEKARRFCETAIQLNPKGWEGHFRLAVALGRLALFRGGKEKIYLAKQVKAHGDTAVMLNPNADLAWHLIGRWHQDLANLNWALKAVAKVVFGGVPPASNQEAVDAFQKAISINPNHIEHHLELARTYKFMGKSQLMKPHLEKVLQLPPVEEDDPKFKEEAREMLKELQ